MISIICPIIWKWQIYRLSIIFFNKFSPKSDFATKRHKIAFKRRKMALKFHKIALKMHNMVLKRHRIKLERHRKTLKRHWLHQKSSSTSFAQILSNTNPVELESEPLFHNILFNGEAAAYIFVWHVHKLCFSQQILYLAPSHCLCVGFAAPKVSGNKQLFCWSSWSFLVFRAMLSIMFIG